MLILKAIRNLSSLDARALRTVVKLTTLVNAFEVKYIHSIYNGCYEVTFNGSEPSLKGTINASKYGIKARNIEKERRLEVILPFKGLFIHNNINGFGLEIYVGVNGGLYYWSNGSKPYHNPARFGYVALHP